MDYSVDSLHIRVNVFETLFAQFFFLVVKSFAFQFINDVRPIILQANDQKYRTNIKLKHYHT